MKKNSKKSVVLLITLFFVMLFTSLIIKNLNDSENFITLSQTTHNLTQTNISVKNINEQIMKLFKDKKDNVDLLLSTLPNNLPLSFENIKIQIQINKIQKDELYNLNDPRLSDNINTELIDNIYYAYDFFSLIKDKNISNYRQVDDIVNEYISITKDKKILNIKDKFIFIDFNINTENNTTSIDNNNTNINANTRQNNSTFIICKYNLDIGGLKSHVDMIFKVGDLNTTYFDFYFKN